MPSCPIVVTATVKDGEAVFAFAPHPSEWVLCGLSLRRVETAITEEISKEFPSAVGGLFTPDTAERLSACALRVLELFYGHGLIRLPGFARGVEL